MTLVAISPNKRSGSSLYYCNTKMKNNRMMGQRETLASGKNNARCGTPRTPNSCKFAISPPKLSEKEQPLWLFQTPPPSSTGSTGSTGSAGSTAGGGAAGGVEQVEDKWKSPSLLQQAFHQASWLETSPPPPPKPSRYSPSRVAIAGGTKFWGGELDIPFHDGNQHTGKRSLASLFDLVVCECQNNDDDDDKENQASTSTLASPPCKRNKKVLVPTTSTSSTSNMVLLAPRRGRHSSKNKNSNVMNHSLASSSRRII
eukprot:Nitzschia sp. Nitz4//scaffold274_size25273//6052//6822//NITZ4_008325-RA/size25273-processed-gene-0.34-mRNA-1//-1//CDS//3329545275//7648//frame0